jgi:NAD(P)H-nitrite reductase large subunit
MQGLYLLPESWYDDYGITCWLNTLVTGIDRDRQQVNVAEGDALPYDRLILAMGSAGRVPAIEGFGIPGTFVLREAADAMAMRAYAQQHACQHAVVAGGGLLGLEAAYALHKLGTEVTVLERGDWLMRRQIDQRGAALLEQYLNGIGISVLFNAEADQAHGTPRLRRVVLKGGQGIQTDLLLACAGVIPNTALAKQADLEVRQGVVVDAHMRTSDPLIYAAGDIAEFEGQVYGLWPIAVEQAQVAAANVADQRDEAVYTGIVPTTMLKVAGIDLMSIGEFEPRSEADTVIVLEDVGDQQYRKLVVAEGRIIGAILLGYPRLGPAVKEAIESGQDVSGLLPALRAGQWDALGRQTQPA